MAKKETDIRKTGPQSYRDLQEQNNPANYDLSKSPYINLKPQIPYVSQTDMIYEGYEKSPLLQSGNGYWGKSQYDNPTATEDEYTLEGLQEARYENQPWYDVLANGLGKMFGTAATTFVSSLVGLPYGIGAAINEGRWSALWDNEVTQALGDADKWLEENMTNYMSKEQQEDPTFRFGDLNWWADNVIGNMGFALGAAASMAVGSGSMGFLSKAFNLTNKIGKTGKAASNFVSSLYSATGEGMIEAKKGVEGRNKLKLQELEKVLAPERNALQLKFQAAQDEYMANQGKQMIRTPEGGMVDAARLKYDRQMLDLAKERDLLQQKYAAGKRQIEESGYEMGNKILLGNQVLLTANNLFQLSRGMSRAFEGAEHAYKATNKAVKPRFVNAERVGSNLKDGYKITGKKAGRAFALLKNPITEGSEEMNQQWIQSSAAASVDEKDTNDYWRARLDPDAYRETTKGFYTLGNIISQGFKESWYDGAQWEQFLVGALTGMTGSYMPTKIFNQDKTKSKWNPTRYGSWEGGVVNEWRDFNKDYAQYEENINDLNRILAQEEFPARIHSAVAHTYLEGEKEKALEEDNKEAWENADEKQFIQDVQAFYRAGKVDDLRAIYNETGANLSDDDIENIVRRTTREVTPEEDRQKKIKERREGIQARNNTIAELRSQQVALEKSIYDIQDNVERDKYAQQAAPQLAEIEKAIEREEAAIQADEEFINNYQGQGYKSGPFVDYEGHQMYTNDEIRERLQNNSKELNRKLDSYLESIYAVQAATGGQLTKDQEDNLAYLHNMGKESIVRMNKEMAKVRKQLPSKFLLKTSLTPEELSKKYATSDLTFSKDENTKEGYVEVDTSLMTDDAFATFFQKEIMRGGNINPEFAETADEKAAREEEEKNLPEEERKKKARERASKKWKETIEKMKADTLEQLATNWEMLADNFMENYRQNSTSTYSEAVDELGKVANSILYAAKLYNQAGEYYKTRDEYMRNPEKIDEDRAKEENRAAKEEGEKQAKEKFVGKTAKEMNQEIAAGTLDPNEVDDWGTDASVDGVSADDARGKSKQEARKSKDIRQKANSLKQHVQDSLPENPTAEELSNAQKAMQKIDNAALEAEDEADISFDSPQMQTPIVDDDDFSQASIEDVEKENQEVMSMLADAFNAFNEDLNAQDDIPDEAPSVDDVEAPETGDDPVTKVDPIVVAPETTSPSEASEDPIPQNPLTEDAFDTIKDAVNEATDTKANKGNGTWRSTTTRYGKYKKGDFWVMSDKPYHELVSDKNSLLYKRSKAIWEYFNSQGVFDRQEDSTNSRTKEGDTIHFVVKNMSQEIYSKAYDQLTEKEKSTALVILMMNENGEILGDLPLAQLEPSYREGNPSDQVKYLVSLQDKVFKAFDSNYKKTGNNEAVVDDKTKEGADNLNLTFDNSKKPLQSKVKQVMRGKPLLSKTEINTLNEIFEGQPFELGVAVTDVTIATRRKGKEKGRKSIIKPRVGTVGQPYLLLPTPSGEQLAIPFYMKSFDAEKHKNTEFYKILSSAIHSLLINNSYSTQEQKKEFLKALDVVKGLLQIKPQENVRTVMVGKDNVTFYFQSITNKNQKITVSASNASGNNHEIVRQIVDQLSGIPINVSLQFLNGTIEASGRKANYNKVIGEIADANIPKGTTHTVNGWFTVEIASSEGIKPSKKIVQKTTGIISAIVGGRSVEINTDTNRAYDPFTKEEIKDNEEINLRIAQIQAERQGKDRIKVSINGEVRTYDANENKFVKIAPITKKSQTKEAYDKIMSDPRTWVADLLGNVNDNRDSFTEESAIEYIKKKFQDRGEDFDENTIKLAVQELKLKKPESSSLSSEAANFLEQPETTSQLNSVNIELPTITGDRRQVKAILISKGDIKEGDEIAITASGSTNYIWDYGRITFVEGDSIGIILSSSREVILPKDRTYYKILKNNPQTLSQPKTQAKTLEQIEDEMKQKKVVGRQTKDAWDAIPDSLKLKLVNEGAAIELSYSNKKVTVSTDNLQMLTKGLKEVNMAAKAGNLKVSEAVKPMEKKGESIQKENQRKAKQWLAKNLPSLSAEERTQFVEKLSRMGNSGSRYWGSYRNGVLQIQQNAPMGTVYHEAFHYVLDMVLSPKERQNFLDIAKEEYGVEDNWTAEERLAEDFRRYSLDANATGIVGRLKRWFRKLRDKINRYNRISDTTVNQLFWKINNGELAQRSIEAESFEDNQQRVLGEIRNVQKEKLSWGNLSKETKEALKEEGLTEEKYNMMSLEEKDQYVKCRG